MTWNLGLGLEERGVVVTGGTGGIGRTVAEPGTGSLARSRPTAHGRAWVRRHGPAMLRDGASDADLQSGVAMTPLGRLATPEEVAGTVVFHCSDQPNILPARRSTSRAAS